MIYETINQQNFELLADAIGSILVSELESQSKKTDNDNESRLILRDTTVWKERIVPYSQGEKFIISVIWAGADYSNKTSSQVDGASTFFLDCYGSARTNDNGKGDQLGAVRTKRLVGVIRSILEHPDYRNLGLDRSIIGTSMITSIKRTTLEGQEDAAGVCMYRVTLEINSVECSGFNDAVLLTNNSTSVILEETEKGYKYIYGD